MEFVIISSLIYFSEVFHQSTWIKDMMLNTTELKLDNVIGLLCRFSKVLESSRKECFAQRLEHIGSLSTLKKKCK